MKAQVKQISRTSGTTKSNVSKMLDFKRIAQVSLPLCQESQEFYIFLLNVKI